MYLIKHDTIDMCLMQNLVASLLVRIQEEEMAHQMAWASSPLQGIATVLGNWVTRLLRTSGPPLPVCRPPHQ